MRRRLLILAAALGLAATTAAAGPAPIKRLAGPDGGFDYASYDPVHRRVYVARSYGVMAVDLASGKVAPTFAKGALVHSVVVLPGSDLLLTTNSGDNTARLLNGADGSLKISIPVGKKPDGAAFDPATGNVFVMNGLGGTASVVDPKAMRVTGTVQIGGGLEFAVTDGAGRLYVNVEDRNEVAVVDTRRQAVVARRPLKGCDGPTGLALTKAGVLISACGNGVAVATDAATGATLATLPIGRHPDAVIYDAARGVAYIPCGDSAAVTVVRDANTRKPQVGGSIATQKSAKTGAFDPVADRLYLPAATMTAGPGGRPAPRPGSFAVLVVAPNANGGPAR